MRCIWCCHVDEVDGKKDCVGDVDGVGEIGDNDGGGDDDNDDDVGKMVQKM